MTSITIPAQTIAAQNIPITVTVKAETVPAQTVALPNSGASVGTYGDGTHVAQVAVNAQGIVTGASSVPIAFPSPSVSTPPDFATTVATIGQGKFIDWTWGDVALAAPAVANMNTVCNGAGLDMHGAKITPATGFPAGADGLSFICPITNANNTIVRGLLLRGFTIAGFPGNNLALSSLLGSSCIRGYQLRDIVTLGAGKSGVLLSGGVFEGEIWGLVAGSNGAHGAEMHQPTLGNNVGIMSSNNWFGGTFQDNALSGIAATADVAYQEAQGFYTIGCNLINNGGPGIRGVGMAGGAYLHTEANCHSPTTESKAGVYLYGGTTDLYNCQGTDSGGNQKYLLDVGSPGIDKVTRLRGCGVWDQGSGFGMKLVRLFGGGTLKPDCTLTAADFDNTSPGNWQIVEPVTTTRTV